jgi:hypothetical protein
MRHPGFDIRNFAYSDEIVKASPSRASVWLLSENVDVQPIILKIYPHFVNSPDEPGLARDYNFFSKQHNIPGFAQLIAELDGDKGERWLVLSRPPPASQLVRTEQEDHAELSSDQASAIIEGFADIPGRLHECGLTFGKGLQFGDTLESAEIYADSLFVSDNEMFIFDVSGWRDILDGDLVHPGEMTSDEKWILRLFIGCIIPSGYPLRDDDVAIILQMGAVLSRWYAACRSIHDPDYARPLVSSPPEDTMSVLEFLTGAALDAGD